MRAGVGGSLELDGWPGVPVAALLEYRYEGTYIAYGGRNATYGTHRLGGGLYYSGSRTTTFGVAATGQLGADHDPYSRLVRVGLVVQGYL